MELRIQDLTGLPDANPHFDAPLFVSINHFIMSLENYTKLEKVGEGESDYSESSRRDVRCRVQGEEYTNGSICRAEKDQTGGGGRRCTFDLYQGDQSVERAL